MPQPYYHQETFTKVLYAGQNLKGVEFSNCTFKHCDFTDALLAGAVFSDCTFNTCNLSMANLSQVKLENASFDHCKMLGINFNTCSDFLFSVAFTHTNLDYCNFMRKQLKGTCFSDCSLKEVNFAECNLTGASFAQCDLDRAQFRQTNLEKADFREAYNFCIDPEFNKLKKAKFSEAGLRGLLDKYDIVVS